MKSLKLTIYFSFPGAKVTYDFPNLLKLFLSSDPDSSIRAQVALSGGYEKCTDDQYTANKQQKCKGDGNVWSEENLNCYKVMDGVSNFSFGFNYLCNRSLINFQNDQDIETFINLIRSGITG
jgi:hypothetical protein